MHGMATQQNPLYSVMVEMLPNETKAVLAFNKKTFAFGKHRTDCLIRAPTPEMALLITAAH